MGPWGYILANNDSGVRAIATAKYDGKPIYHAIVVCGPGKVKNSTAWFKAKGIDPKQLFNYSDGATHAANEIAVASGRVDPMTRGQLLEFRSLTDKPVKVALPGPYLLTRTMWMECAQTLLAQVTKEIPPARLGLHVCRGNWTRDERAALAGDYRPLLPFIADAPVGTLFLELATSRAGELDVLADLPRRLRIGAGVVNQKDEHVAPAEATLRAIAAAAALVRHG